MTNECTPSLLQLFHRHGFSQRAAKHADLILIPTDASFIANLEDVAKSFSNVVLIGNRSVASDEKNKELLAALLAIPCE